MVVITSARYSGIRTSTPPTDGERASCLTMSSSVATSSG